MMSTQAKKPEIRFKGFTDDWEQRKLGEIGDTYTGLSGKSKEDFGHGEGKFVTYMNVFSNTISNPRMTEPVEIDGRQNKVQVGDVFFTTSSETPEEVGISSVWLENSDDTYLNSFCFGYRPREEFDNYFLAYMLRSTTTRKKIAFLAQGISRYNISKSKVMEITVPKPKIVEQEQIGRFFTYLDYLIILHQQKYEKLVIIKKAMLEKMFPKEGCNVPELRFGGLENSWKKCKVKDVLIERDEQSPESSEYPLMAFIAYKGVAPKGDRYDRSFLVNDNENKVYKRTEHGDFIYSSNNLETGSIGLNKYGKASISPVYSIFKPNEGTDSDFIGRMLSKKDFINEMVKWRQGVVYGQWRIHESDFMEINILVPETDEQKLIGRYFDELDNLIYLQQQKVEKLKKIKFACIQKMFV